MSYFESFNVRMLDSPNMDGAAKIRTSTPSQVFGSKNTLTKDNYMFRELTSGAGSAISYSANDSAVQCLTTTTSGGYAIRESYRTFAYVPGKSMLVLMTSVLGNGRTNTVKRVGMFDDNDGLFFELSATELRVVRRTSTSGSVVDNAVAQSSWNIDVMDGTTSSGIDLDTTAIQTYVIDFSWLGSGRVRFGVMYNGEIFYCHEFNNANTLATAFMASPDLPLRYEVRNTGVATGSTSIFEYSSSILVEGGYSINGIERSVSHGTSMRTSIYSRTPVLAVRLKTSYNSKNNKNILKMLESAIYSVNDVGFIEYALLEAPSSITASWQDAFSGTSAAEYSTDISAVTGNPEHILDSFHIGNGEIVRKTFMESKFDSGFNSIKTYIAQNSDSSNSDMFVIYATPMGGNPLDVSCSVKWLEFN